MGLYSISLYGLYFLLIITIIYLISILIDAYKVMVWGYAPYIRSGKKIVNRILQEVDFRDNSVVYELGCGDGRFIRELAKQREINCIGYEYSLAPYLLAKLFNFFSRKKVKIYYKNFFNENLSNADYVFCYLMPKPMEKLSKKFENELSPGAVIISNTFAIKNWRPKKVIELKKRGVLSNKIYIYIK
ncbi:hypothetical protein JW977_03485 [Candidatus Falkowbacteria bacterium]|nr:hypothetical protein [Candidatus Falkowbacteria bacterium]